MQVHDLGKYAALHKFSREDSELKIGRWRVSKLIEHYGTPLYVYDGTAIEGAYHLVSKALPQFEVFYSIKANPSLAICSMLQCLGAGAEVASGGELCLSLEAGFKPSKIIFAGPAKTDEELTLAVRTGIASVNVESFNELARLESIARREGKQVNACLRINTKGPRILTPEVMAGGSSRFGIDEELVFEKLDKIALALENVHIVGIHVYTASQILDVETIVSNLQRTLLVGSNLSGTDRVRFKLIIFGGGFGVPYEQHERNLDTQILTTRVHETIEASKEKLSIQDKRLIVELGRFLVAQSGIFLTRVVDIKVSRGRTYLLTDGGMNQFLRPVLMKLNHPTLVVTRLGELETDKVDIGGPLCTPIDLIATEVHVPKVEAGDIVGFFNAGAYGFSMSMADFLSHPKPPELLFHNGYPYLIRNRGTLEDILRKQRIPPGLAPH